MEKLKEVFLQGFKERLGLRRIGVEEEILIVNEKGEMGDTDLVWEEMKKSRWEPVTEEGKIKGFIHPQSGWIVITDAGRGTLEIVSLPEEDLHKVYHYTEEILRVVRRAVLDSGQYLVGLGIQPYTKLGKSEERDRLWQESRRYDFLRLRLSPGVDVATLTAATQTHIEVAREENFQAFLVFNALSGPMIALAANSTVWQGKPDKRVAVRADCWREFAQDRSGMPPRFRNLEEMLRYMSNLPYYFSANGCTFQEILKKQKEEADIITALAFQESTCWWDSRLRSSYGTLEIRPCCQQPPWVPRIGLHALHLGIAENLEKVYEFVSQKPWSFWEYLRKEAIKKGAVHQKNSEVIKIIIRLAVEGLQKRGCQEEDYLYEYLIRKNLFSLPWLKARERYKDRKKLIHSFVF